MGCFGYLCPECGKNVRGDCFDGGEDCTMFHLRHGEVLGSIQGHYNEYGRTFEDDGKTFRTEEEGINSHSEMCDSDFSFADSSYNVEGYYKTLNSKGYLPRHMLGHDYAKSMSVEEVLKFLESVPNFKTPRMLLRDDEMSFEERIKIIRMDIGSFYDRWDIIQDGIQKKIDDGVYKKMDWSKAKSGIACYHTLCYNKAKDKEGFKLQPSKNDPDQSWGTVRKRFK